MPRYIVREYIDYLYEADSKQEAVDKFWKDAGTGEEEVFQDGVEVEEYLGD